MFGKTRDLLQQQRAEIKALQDNLKLLGAHVRELTQAYNQAIEDVAPLVGLRATTPGYYDVYGLFPSPRAFARNTDVRLVRTVKVK